MTRPWKQMRKRRTKDTAYEVWVDRAGWKTYVLKYNGNPEKAYATALVIVSQPLGDSGPSDSYVTAFQMDKLIEKDWPTKEE